MIAEPYICIKGPKLGQVSWMNPDHADLKTSSKWQPYAYFEREKLRELELGRIGIGHGFAFCLGDYRSVAVINYWMDDYEADSESSRLLKRAEFLKAVCEKEGVEWLPKTTEAKKPKRMEPLPYCTCEESPDPDCSMHKKERKEPYVGWEMGKEIDPLSSAIKTALKKELMEEKEWRKDLLEFLKWHCVFSKIDDPYEALSDLRSKHL